MTLRRVALYVENKGYKSAVCASCNQTYELVSSDWIDSSVEEQKKYYDMAVKFRKRSGMEIIPFGPIVLDYKNAPKGWTNEILCKSCFDNVQVGFEDEIKQMHKTETERLGKEAAQKAEEEVQRHQKEYKDAVEERNFWRFMQILFVIFTVPIFFSMCSGSGSGETPPADIYYRK